MKNRRNFEEKEECQMKINKPKNKMQLRPLTEGFNEMLSLESNLKDTRKRNSEIYDMPNSSRPRLTIKTERNKKNPYFVRDRMHAFLKTKELT